MNISTTQTHILTHTKLITLTLEALYINRFPSKTWYGFCKPPLNHRTSKLLLLDRKYTKALQTHCLKLCQHYRQNFPCNHMYPYTKDTMKFRKSIQHLDKCKLASIDVSFLYTKIPYKDMKSKVLLVALHNKQPMGTYNYPELPNPCRVSRGINSLKNDVFEFNGNYSLQKQRTAMRNKIAPMCTNLHNKPSK